MRWYLDTWRTPYWRRVLATVLFVASFVALLWTTEQAKRGAGAGGGWGTLAVGALPGLAIAALLLAAAAWPTWVNARLDGRSPGPELAQALLTGGALVLLGIARVVSVRRPALGPWIPVAAVAALGVLALVGHRRRPAAWTWAAAMLAIAAWLGWRAAH